MSGNSKALLKTIRLYTMGLALSVLVFSVSCIPGPDYLSNVAAFYSSDGALHVLARKRSSGGEGGGWAHLAFLYAKVAPDGSTETFSPPVNSFGGCCSGGDLNMKFVDGADGQYMVLPTSYGLSTWVNDGTGWSEVSAADLSDDTFPDSQLLLLAAWPVQNTVYILTDKWLYAVQGKKYLDAYSVSGDCASSLCYAIPGKAPGVVAEGVYLNQEVVRTELVCDDVQKTCAFTDTKETLGTGDYGGGSYEGRYLFRTLDDSGKDVLEFIRNVSAENLDDNYRILASSPSGDYEVLSKNSFGIAAAPLPAGGYVVASVKYGGEFLLAVVDADLKSKHIFSLHENSEDFMGGLGLVCSGTKTQDQRAHVIFGAGSDSLRHLTVNPSTGEVEQDSYIDF